jgi:hypothetical protein
VGNSSANFPQIVPGVIYDLSAFIDKSLSGISTRSYREHEHRIWVTWCLWSRVFWPRGMLHPRDFVDYRVLMTIGFQWLLLASSLQMDHASSRKPRIFHLSQNY